MADSIADLRKAFYGTTEQELTALRNAVAAGKTFSSLVDTTAVGFYDAAPVAQPAGIANVVGTGGVVVDAEARAAIDALITRLETLGLIATV